MTKNLLVATRKRRTYSAEWAKMIVEVWWQDAPRASDFLCKTLGVDKKTVVGYLQNGLDEWEFFKACRKMLLRIARIPHLGTGLTSDDGFNSTYVERMEANVIALWENLRGKPVSNG